MNLKYSIEEISAFKYAPITSCEAERSFPVFLCLKVFSMRNVQVSGLKTLKYTYL